MSQDDGTRDGRARGRQLFFYRPGYQAGVRPIRQENKLLVPAAFSPVR
jgi:hypothetical protein